MTIEERNQLIEDNIKCLYKASNKYAHLCPGYEIDDLVGIASVALTKATAHYDGSQAFTTFAYLCVRNAFLTELRDSKAQKRRGQVLSLDAELCPGKTMGDTIPAPVCDEAERIDMSDLITRSLGVLSAQEREYCILHHRDGLPQKIIAAQNDVTKQRIQQIITVAVRKMRRIQSEYTADRRKRPA